MAQAIRRSAIYLSFLLAFIASGANDRPIITAEVIPSSLELPISGSASTTLVLRNPTESKVIVEQIVPTAFSGIKVTVDPPGKKVLSPKSVSIWTVKINRATDGILSGNLTLRIHYAFTEVNNKKTNDVLIINIPVSSQEQEDVSQVMAVTLHSALSEINDFRPGYIYLKVQNKSDASIEISDVVVSERPEFIEIRPSLNSTPIPQDESRLPYDKLIHLSVGESKILPIYVSAGGQVRPGKHLLLFNVFFNRKINGQEQTGSMAVEHEINVQVFGEEEVTGAITSVTSFLFIPGFLMIIVSGMAWKVLVPSPMKDKFPFSIKTTTIADPRFWVTMITLSLLMAWKVYPALSGLFLAVGRRDYLYGYGFQDIIWMWLFSVLIGVFFTIVFATIFRFNLEIRTYIREVKLEKEYNQSDNPLTIIEKMVNHKYNEIPFIEATHTEASTKGFLIEPLRENKKTYWVSPRVIIWWHTNADKLRDKFAEIIDAEGTQLSDLQEILLKGANAPSGEGIYEITWAEEEGYVEEPTKIKNADYEFSKTGKNFFLHEWRQ